MFANVLILVFLLMAFGRAAAEYGCPEPEDISPCSCKEELFAHLYCKDLNDRDKVKEIFSNSLRYHFYTFTMENCTLQYIPHEIFDDVEVKYIHFYKVTFVNTFDRIPRNPGVETVTLVEVKILRGWDWNKLSIFTQLRELNVVDMPMKRLSTDFRPNITKKLKKLRFMGCSIKKFRDDEFQDFTDLEILNADHNEITTLKRSMFARPSRLREIRLQHNLISQLPDDTFEDMPKLNYINLNNNRLSFLPEAVYQPLLANPTYVYVYDNPLKCDCLIKWLTFDERKYFKGKCGKPKKFNGKHLRDLKPQDFRC